MPKTYRLNRVQLVRRPLAETFAFFADAGNLQAITPDFLHFRFVTPLPIEMREGTLIEYRLRLSGVPIFWRTRIDEFVPLRRFVDSQVRGPYGLWRHQHDFYETREGVLVIDQVDYQIPLGPLGRVAHGMFVGAMLERIFDYRQVQIARLLESARAWQSEWGERVPSGGEQLA